MNTQIFLKPLLLLSMVVMAFSPLRAQEASHKIVMQLTSSDPMVHKGLLKQLNNLKDGWGDSVQMVVVCHGPGIEFLQTEKTQYREQIYKAMERGVVFIACENTLKEKNMNREQILPEMQYVRMGIAEIVRRQEQGWSYIKAGF